MTVKSRIAFAFLAVFGVVAAIVTIQIVLWVLEAREFNAQQAISAGAPTALLVPPLEEMILGSDTIVRVRFIEAEARTWKELKPSQPYVAYMALKFEVLEYLKGGAGLDTTWGGLGLEDAEVVTEQEALDKAQRYLNERDTRWDSREAIIIFQGGSGNRDDFHSIGWIGPRSSENPWRRWLPASSRNGGASGSDGEPQFLWADSRRNSTGASGASGGTVTLTELRALSRLSDTELEKLLTSTYGFVEVVEDHSAESGVYLLSAKTTSGRITLEWRTSGSDASGVIGYRILRRKQSDAEFIQLADVTVEDRHYVYTDTDSIEPETEYIYVVRPYTASGDLSASSVTITTAAELGQISVNATSTPDPLPTATPQTTGTPTSTPTPEPTHTPTTAPAEEHTASPDPAPTPTSDATLTTPATAIANPMTEDTPTPLASSSESAASLPAPYPLPTLEQMIEGAHIVARVRLSSTASRVERIETGHMHLNGGRYFALFMDFEFDVMEYLKGSGNSRIWGSVMAGRGFDTRKDALAAAVAYWKIRDKYIYSRWDDREAIVMLYDVSSLTANLDKGLVRQSDTYLLGKMVVGNGFWESYSVASPMHKAWLPSALPSGGASGASGGEQEFLLDAPGGYAAGGPSEGASGASEADAPKISLSSFKAKIAEAIGTPTPTATATPSPTHTPTPAPAEEPTATPDPRQRQLQCQR